MNDNEKVVSEIESADNSASPKKHGRLDIVALIVSLIIALSIWIYVVNTTQSEIERTITVSVDISGQIYEDTGMTIFSKLSQAKKQCLPRQVTLLGTINSLSVLLIV